MCCSVFIELRNWLLQGFGAPWVGCMWIHPIYELTSWLCPPGSYLRHVISQLLFRAPPSELGEEPVSNHRRYLGWTLLHPWMLCSRFQYAGASTQGLYLPKASTQKKQKLAIVNPSSTIQRPPHIRDQKQPGFAPASHWHSHAARPPDKARVGRCLQVK